MCLHTAGADSRQYRGLLNDAETLAKFRVIAFDLPWHGKSSPPADWHKAEYKLTSRAYVDTIMAVVDALGLDKPVVMGCSIGGRIVLHLALEHATRFRALIGLESGAHADPYYDLDWLHRPDVHGGEVCGGMISGLIAPTAPEADRWETIWHYMQGGPGVFKGDLHFYTADGDVRGRVAEIDTGKCPLYLLTGEYDYSCTPEITRELARRIEGAEATIMEGLGHFPMSEDPARFFEVSAASAGEHPQTGIEVMTPIGLFRGERALVTGSASNIGRAIAIALAREGAAVRCVDIDPARNAADGRGDRQARRRGGGRHRRSLHRRRLACGAARRRARRFAMLVHSASPPRRETDGALAVSEATWDAMVNTNVRSGFFLARELGRRMQDGGIKGRMLFITSLHAETPRNIPHYAASKAGQTMVVKELARALGPAGIRVNALAPGAVPGGGFNAAAFDFSDKIPLGRLGRPEDMADMALALLSDRFSGYVTGTTVAVDGGIALYNWIPLPTA